MTGPRAHQGVPLGPQASSRVVSKEVLLARGNLDSKALLELRLLHPNYLLACYIGAILVNLGTLTYDHQCKEKRLALVTAQQADVAENASSMPRAPRLYRLDLCITAGHDMFHQLHHRATHAVSQCRAVQHPRDDMQLALIRCSC